jgi:hypothetical protein
MRQLLRAHRRDGNPLELHGAARVARGAITARRFAPYVRPVLINGAAGAVAFDGERPFAVLAFTVIDDRAVAIDVFNDAELVAKLDIRGITAKRQANTPAKTTKDAGAGLVTAQRPNLAACQQAPKRALSPRGHEGRSRLKVGANLANRQFRRKPDRLPTVR